MGLLKKNRGSSIIGLLPEEYELNDFEKNEISDIGKCETSDSDVKEKEDYINKLENDIQEKMAELNAANSHVLDINRLKEENEHLVEDMAEKRSDLEQLVLEIEKKKSIVKDYDTTITQMTAKVKKLEERLEEYNSMIEKNSSEINAISQEKSAMTDELELVIDERNRVAEELDKEQKDLVEKQAMLNETITKKEEILSELENIEKVAAELLKKKKQLLVEKETLEKQINEEELSKEYLQAEISMKIGQNREWYEEIAKELEKSQNENAALKQRKEQMQHEKSMIQAELEAEISAKKQMESDLREKLQLAEYHLAACENEVQVAEDGRNDLLKRKEEIQREKEKLQEELNREISVKAEIEAELETVQNVKEESKNLLVQKEQVQNEKLFAQKALENEISEKERIEKELREKLNEVSNRHIEIEKAVQQSENEISVLRGRKSQLEEEKEETKKELEQQNELVSDLKTELEDIKSQMSSKENEIEAIRNNIERISSECTILSNDEKKYKEELELAKENTIAAYRLVEEQRNAAEEARKKLKEYEDDREKIEHEKITAKNEVDEFVESVHAEIEKMKTEAQETANKMRDEAVAEADYIKAEAQRDINVATAKKNEALKNKRDAEQELEKLQNEVAELVHNAELEKQNVLLKKAEYARETTNAQQELESIELEMKHTLAQIEDKKNNILLEKRVKEQEAREKKEEALKQLTIAQEELGKASEIKMQAEAMINKARSDSERLLEESERKAKEIEKNAIEKYERYLQEEKEVQEYLKEINYVRKQESVEEENEPEKVLTAKEKKALMKKANKQAKIERKLAKKEEKETRKLAKKGLLPERTQNQIIQDAIKNMIDEHNLFGSARKDLEELIVCDGISPNNNEYLKLSDGFQDIYVMCFYVDTNPRETEFASTYEEIMNSDKVTSSISIEPILDGKASKALDKRVLVLDSEITGAEKDGDRNRARKLRAKMSDVESYASDVETGAKKMFEVSYLFSIWNTDLEKLQLEINDIHNKALNKGVVLCSCFSVHPEAYVSMFPVNKLFCAKANSVVKTTCVKKHTMDADSLSSIFNHTRSDFYHEKGIICGRNMSTGRPATFDPYDKMFDSYGVVVCGKTGTGKSATVKMYFTRFADFGVKIASIDFEKIGSRGEYSRACEVVGGENFVVKVDSKEVLNPYELEPEIEYNENTDEEKEDLLLINKISDLTNIIYTMVTIGKKQPDYEIEVFYEEIIRKINMELYSELGIYNHDVDSLYVVNREGNRVKKKLPTLSDFYKKLLLEYKRNTDVLKEKAFALLISSMQRYIKYCAYTETGRLIFFDEKEVASLEKNDLGQRIFIDNDNKEHIVSVVVGDRSFFDGQSTFTVDLDTPWVNIDISSLNENDKPIAEAIAASFLNENFIKKNSANPNKAHHRIIMIDECHKMFAHEHLRKFLSDLYRTARKRLISPWLITQAVYDFNGYKETGEILEQSATKILLKQEPDHGDYIKEVTRMTDSQLARLYSLGGDPMDKSQGNSRKGELCMVMDGHCCFIKVDYLQDSEFDVVETDLKKIREKYEERRKAHAVA